MKDSILLTILVGVCVFVICQFILKLVLDPVVEFKKFLGKISHLFLTYQASITNANGSLEIQNEIRMLSASLLSLKEAIPCYSFMSRVLRLPSANEIAEACGALNLISYSIVEEDKEFEPKKDHAHEIYEQMNRLGKSLKIRVKYSES